jgi:peptide chain release factor 3
VPSFAPEILRRVRLTDAMKAKKLKQALQEMAEEGVVQVFRPTDGSPALIGVVGPSSSTCCATASPPNTACRSNSTRASSSSRAGFRRTTARRYEEFIEANRSGIADDLDGDAVYLARSQFYLDYTRERAPGIVFTDVKDVKAAKVA